MEEYGKRKYKKDFIRFLVYAHASLLECISQLEMIHEIHQLENCTGLLQKYDILGAKLFTFMQYVEREWRT